MEEIQERLPTGEPVQACEEDITKKQDRVPESAQTEMREEPTEAARTETREEEAGKQGEPPAEQTENEPYIPRRRNRFCFWCYRFIKRTFDILSSALLLILLSWLFLILAILVKCSDGGPVFYRHKRVGKNGKDIFIPKFRSMKVHADRLEDVLTPEQLEEYRKEYKIDADPRITKLGKFLRKTSLDELPNIWSIFIGDISVIGPRPLMREELEEKYGDDAEKLLSVKPGMIGWWAANGRSNTTYESGERQKLELYYVDHCSCKLDIIILFKTLISVFKRTGAK